MATDPSLIDILNTSRSHWHANLFFSSPDQSGGTSTSTKRNKNDKHLSPFASNSIRIGSRGSLFSFGLSTGLQRVTSSVRHDHRHRVTIGSIVCGSLLRCTNGIRGSSSDPINRWHVASIRPPISKLMAQISHAESVAPSRIET